MSVTLAGTGSAGTSNLATAFAILDQFTATVSGDMTAFAVYTAVAGNVKLALYSDVSGSPTNLLWSYNTSQTCSTTSGWDTLTAGGPFPKITAGTVYWLGATADTTGTLTRLASGNTRWIIANTYSTYTWPATAGAGWTTGSFTCCFAIYGTTTSGQFFQFFNY